MTPWRTPATTTDWAPPANVGHIVTTRSPDFDPRTDGYAKLSSLIAATALFEIDRRTPGDGKPSVVFIRDRRHDSARRR